MDDEQTTSVPEPELTGEDAAAPEVAEEVPAESAEAEPEVPAEEPEAEPADEPAPVTEQLSLDEMVGELKETDAAEEPADTEAECESPAEAEAVVEGATEETVAPPVVAESPEGAVLARARLAARLPFWILTAVWAVFAGVMMYLLWADATKAFTSLPLYAALTFGGVGLTVAGPLLGLAVWLLLRRGEPELRGGLVRAVLLRAAVATLAGNLMWWASLIVLDLHRSGVL